MQSLIFIGEWELAFVYSDQEELNEADEYKIFVKMRQAEKATTTGCHNSLVHQRHI